MTNEHYLYVSYAADALLTIGLSLCVCRWLYRPHAALADACLVRPWATVLKRAFSFGISLPAVIGFLSVSYTATSCGDLDYATVVQSRERLIAKTHEQITGVLNWTAFALFVWGILVVVILATSTVLRANTKVRSDNTK